MLIQFAAKQLKTFWLSKKLRRLKEFRPVQVRSPFNNIIERTFAILLGWSMYRPQRKINKLIGWWFVEPHDLSISVVDYHEQEQFIYIQNKVDKK